MQVRVTNHKAIQVHPVPEHALEPKGPFPRELFKEPEIVYDYAPALDEGGGDFPAGSTVQNGFKPIKYLRCIVCSARVKEDETEFHVCEE
jgi:hypothetical protein